MSIKDLSVQQLQQKLHNSETPILLDVREIDEYKFVHIQDSLHIPINSLAQQLHTLDSQQEIVVICHHGIRSKQAAYFLDHNGFKNIFNLVGGIDAWACECDNSLLRY